MKALGGLRTRSWTFLRGGVEGSGDGEDGGELDGGDEDESSSEMGESERLIAWTSDFSKSS